MNNRTKAFIFALFCTWLSVCGLAHATTLTVWESDWNKLYLYMENDGSVYGHYDYDGGEITGQVQGNLLLGWWRETGNAKSCGPNQSWSGPIAFQFASDRTSFAGTWDYCPRTPGSLDPLDGGWDGTLIPTPDLPDLTGTWLSLAATDTMTISARFQVKNIGSAAANSFKVRFYLSNSATKLPARPFKTYTIMAMEAQKGKTLSFTRTFDRTVAGKYVTAVIDADQQVIESIEKNNKRTKLVQ
ncbi:MAG: CARDB domain-containing protein [Acidobacteriota bacterium]